MMLLLLLTLSKFSNVLNSEALSKLGQASETELSVKMLSTATFDWVLDLPLQFGLIYTSNRDLP